MVFSSISFLYYFLPIMLACYFITPNKYKNITLLIGSLLFYFIGEPKYTVLLLFSTIVDYTHSLIIVKNRGTKKAKYALVSSIVLNITMLAFFKYSDFFIENLNVLLNTNVPLLHLRLPIGISFFTFQTMSYTIDVYRGEAEAQRNPLNLGAYVALFPQLIAGPIVRYKTVAKELKTRQHNFELFSYGVQRFVIGLSKKVLLANPLGELSVIASTHTDGSVLFYWIGIVCYALQIYYDFSGYSDMAIGLGRMFGFHFLENFNYPYISKSISEFWRRWHMSLGAWFRDYVYIPLGGNRGSKFMWLRNIFMVWFLTGFWHGASWNFVIWGILFGSILMLESIWLKKVLEKLPNVVQHIYVLFIVTMSFVVFKNESLSVIITQYKGLFGLLEVPLLSEASIYYLKSYAGVLIIATIGATPLVKNILSKDLVAVHRIVDKVTPLLTIGLLLITTGYIVDSSFNPFLYFRF